MAVNQETYHRDHWVEVSDERHQAYEAMFEWRHEMEPLLAGADLQPGLSVVDYGCGPGHLTVELAGRVAPGGSVVGLDINCNFVARANERAAEAGLAEQVSARLLEGPRLPVEDASADRVICKSVLEYVDDPAAVLAEFHRIARPGGRIHVIDSDWRMLVLEPVGHERMLRLFEAARPAYRTPEIGRRLYGLMRGAGFREVQVSIFAGADTKGRRAAIARNMADYAREFGLMEAAEIDAIVAEMEAAIVEQRYLLVLPQFVVSGLR
jgi:ubiquinone/menaquinone biosynthesis C-methylase UbiE